MNWPEDDYPCIGVCMDDPESGYCLGCGRPPWPVPRTPEDTAADGTSKAVANIKPGSGQRRNRTGIGASTDVNTDVNADE